MQYGSLLLLSEDTTAQTFGRDAHNTYPLFKPPWYDNCRIIWQERHRLAANGQESADQGGLKPN